MNMNIKGIPETMEEIIERQRKEKPVKSKVNPIILRIQKGLEETENPVAVFLGMSIIRIIIFSYYLISFPLHFIIGLYRAFKNVN